MSENPCPDEIDYSYVMMPPLSSKDFDCREVRITKCYDRPRECATCSDYYRCDAPEREDIVGKERTPPMKSRDEVIATMDALTQGQRMMGSDGFDGIFRAGQIHAMEWMLGEGE